MTYFEESFIDELEKMGISVGKASRALQARAYRGMHRTPSGKKLLKALRRGGPLNTSGGDSSRASALDVKTISQFFPRGGKKITESQAISKFFKALKSSR